MPSPKATELFDKVVGLLPEERLAALLRLEPHDKAIQNEVRKLLESNEKAGTFLDQTNNSLAVQFSAELFSQPMEPGQEIEDYVIVSPIGKGGGGTVYVALQRSLKREVALKLTPDIGSEGEIMASLDHENVVTVFDERTLPIENIRLLAMQYVRGTSLDRVIKRLKSKAKLADGQSFLREMMAAANLSFEDPAWEQARRIYGAMDSLESTLWFAKKLAAGLEYTHRKNILHLDIKPGNILIHPSGNPMLTDFNISLNRNVKKKSTQAFGGTKKYMPPEQARLFEDGFEKAAPNLDGRTDLYALSITLLDFIELFEFNTTGNSHAALIRFQNALKKASAPSQHARFNSAQQFIEELEECSKLHLLEKMNTDKVPFSRRLREPRFWIRAAIVLVCASSFTIHELGLRGWLPKSRLSVRAQAEVSRINSLLGDIKIRWRKEAPKSPVVMTAIDSKSMEKLGPWPWRRDILAYLIERLFALGSVAVAIDIVFSETEALIPEEIKEALSGVTPLQALVNSFDTDRKLSLVLRQHRQKLALSWISESACQPKYLPVDQCPVTQKEALQTFPPHFDDSSVETLSQKGFDPQQAVIPSVVTVSTNIDTLNFGASGFSNLLADKDAIVRRASLVTLAKGKAHPSLALSLASLIKEDVPMITLGTQGEVRHATWKKSGKTIPVSGTGVFPINFRGPEGSFATISAVDILVDEPNSEARLRQKLSGSVVLLGITSGGLGHAVSTPVDYAMPRLELHANIVDNLLSDDVLTSQVMWAGVPISSLALFLLMSVGVLLLLGSVDKLKATPAVLMVGIIFLGACFADFLLFRLNFHLATGFLYLEMAVLFVSIVLERFLIDEWQKKNVKLLALAKENELLQGTLTAQTQPPPLAKMIRIREEDPTRQTTEIEEKKAA